jgi:hypothetical protein
VLLVEAGWTCYVLALGGEGVAYLPAVILFSSAILLCVSLLTGVFVRSIRRVPDEQRSGVLAASGRKKSIIATIGSIAAAAAIFLLASDWLKGFFTDNGVIAGFIVVQTSLWSLLFFLVARDEVRARVRTRCIMRGCCGECGYNLRGSKRQCPECGTAFDPQADATDPNKPAQTPTIP